MAEILLVDVPAEVGKALRDSEYDITMVTAATARDALADVTFDLLIIRSDDLSDTVLQSARAAALPVLCIVPEDITPDGVAELYSYGVDDYVTTPICKSTLLARVANQIEVIRGEAKMNRAKDYLYDFVQAVSNDIKNQFIITSQLCDLIRSKKKYDLGDDTRLILSCISDFCTEPRSYIESVAAHASAESRHRGGFVRRDK